MIRKDEKKEEKEKEEKKRSDVGIYYLIDISIFIPND